MLVRDAKAAARDWVLEHGQHAPGFVGAYFSGSVNWMAEDASLPETSDLDVHLVLDDPGQALKPGKFHYREVLLEASYIPRDLVRSPEVVLSTGAFAGPFRARCVILDPTGFLSALQERVEREYAQRRWVRARCERAAEQVRTFAGALKEDVPLHDQVTICAFAAGALTFVLLAAGLRNHTVRKRYVAVREELEEYGRLDFHEELLAKLGCAQMDRARVEQYFVFMTAIFDAAKQALRTPYRFGSDISDVARPISVDGTRELIDRGFHREAAFWIVATSCRSRHILAADAPELLERFDPGLHTLAEDLGIATFDARRRRCDAVVAFLPRVQEVAEQIVAENPEIHG